MSLTREETMEIILQSHAAADEGDLDKAHQIRLKLPLAPHLAKATIDFWGNEAGKSFLLNSGFDLSEAELVYGKDWLNK